MTAKDLIAKLSQVDPDTEVSDFAASDFRK
jgi:hypothetical protein